jgi:hypothetical protein
MRVPGTINARRGRLARIVRLDPARPPVDASRLRARLPDPRPADPRPARPRSSRRLLEDEAAKLTPPYYFRLLAGRDVSDRGGVVRCPVHDETASSCMVYPDVERGWHCFGCGLGGRIYDLASAIDGGPSGRQLYGERFVAVKRGVHERLDLAATTVRAPVRR